MEFIEYNINLLHLVTYTQQLQAGLPGLLVGTQLDPSYPGVSFEPADSSLPLIALGRVLVLLPQPPSSNLLQIQLSSTA